jgi:hypothetical protein
VLWDATSSSTLSISLSLSLSLFLSLSLSVCLRLGASGINTRCWVFAVVPDDASSTEYQRLRTEVAKAEGEIMSVMIQPQRSLHFLRTGRLVRVRQAEVSERGPGSRECGTRQGERVPTRRPNQTGVGALVETINASGAWYVTLHQSTANNAVPPFRWIGAGRWY